MNTNIHSYLLPFSLLLFLSSFSQALPSDSTYNNFLQCLQNQTNSSPNISTILFSETNTTYNSVLQAYIRNLRFTYPTTPKPQLIITPFNPSQVSSTIICARNLDLQVKIRSGGHDYDGLSYISNNKFIILDMSNLRRVVVNPKAASAYIEAGATLGELYYKIQEKSNTLGFPAGVCPTVGVGGHISGGGYGSMIRKHGLSVDHITDATIVDAQGRILNRTTMGDDLFWAIRGGGGASFAVVVSFTVKLVPVPEKVTVFNVKRFLSDNATDLVYKWQFLMKDIDHNLFIRLLLQPVNDPMNKGKKTGRVTFIALYLGDSNTLYSLLKNSFPELGLKKEDCLEMTWGKSALFWANFDNETSPEVLLNRTYIANYSKRKSDYVQKPIPKVGLDLLWKKLITLAKPGLVFNSYGGVMNEISSTDTPFPHRRGNLFKIQYSTSWKDAGKIEDDKNIGLIRELHDFMTPYVSQNPRGAYFNYRDIDIGVSHNWTYKEGEVYGRKYPELGVKKEDCLEMSWAKSLLYWYNFDNTSSVDILLNRSYTNIYLKRKSDYVQKPITKVGLELLWKKLVKLEKIGMVFNSYGGRMNEISSAATPFPHRRGNLYKIQYSANWKDAGKLEDDRNIGLIREVYGFMTPYVSQNPRGAYLNYRDIDIGVSRNWTYKEGEVYGRKYFGGNFDRLVKVKSLVDPNNFFRNEQSIPTWKS